MSQSPRTVAIFAARLRHLPPRRQRWALDACFDLLSYFEATTPRASIRPHPLRATLRTNPLTQMGEWPGLERVFEEWLKQTKAS